MTTVKDMIQRALTLLQDNEAGFESTTWTQDVLLLWVNEGMKQIAAMRPDLFTSVEKITLTSGRTQKLDTTKYVAIYDIDGNVQVGPDGEEIVDDDVSADNAAMLKRFKKKRCLPKDACGCGDAATGYNVSLFVQNQYSQTDFSVEPPVPAGASVEVMATVQRCPAQYTMGDVAKNIELTCPNEPALLDWIMHRAYTIETESEYIVAAKRDHLHQFYASVNGKYTADSRMTSGYVFGQRGDGDRASGPQRDLKNVGIMQ